MHVHTLRLQGKGNNVKTSNCSPFKLKALCTLGLHKLLIRSINYIISVYKGDFLLQKPKTATCKKKSVESQETVNAEVNLHKNPSLTAHIQH